MKLIPGLIGLLLVFLMGSAPAQSTSFNFDQGLGPSFTTWNDGNLWTIDATNGEVRMSKPGDDLSVMPEGIRCGAVSVFTLTGDFIVTVDYRLYDFPADLSHSETYPNILLRLDYNSFSGDNYAVIRFRQAASQELEAWHSPPGIIYGRQQAPPEMLSSGRMRLARTGNVISSSYAPLGSDYFIPLGSAPGVASPLHVRLLATQWTTCTCEPTRANTSMDIAFDNLIIEGSLSYDDPVAEWSDVTTGDLITSTTGGAAWGDYDSDGDLDLYGSLNLYRNDGGGVFVNASTPQFGWGSGWWGDYNNDGRLDIYLSGAGPNRLLRNEGSGAFVNVATGPLADSGTGESVAWADYDSDGDLDLYITNAFSSSKLLRNEGGDTFVDATTGPLGVAGVTYSVSWGDYDNDGDPDIYLGRDAGNKLFRNEGYGAFVDVTSSPLDHSPYGHGVAWGDYDNDGDLDLYLAVGLGANKLLRNEGEGAFSNVTSGPLGRSGVSWGVSWVDYDNDADLDLYVTLRESGPNGLLRNDGGSFVDVAAGAIAYDGGSSGGSAGQTWGDYDDDGDLDVYLNNNPGECKLIRNELSNGNHWLHLDLVGTIANRSAIGARVRVVTESGTQIREVSGGSGLWSQNALTVAFGLGTATVADSVQILWPWGGTTLRLNVGADQNITIVEDYPIPVILSSLTAVPQSNGILLEWATSSEASVSGFHVHRSTRVHGDWRRLTTELVEPSSAYHYLDTEVSPGITYYYRLEALDRSGGREFFGPVSAWVEPGEGAGLQPTLGQAFPNPVQDGSSTVPFTVGESGPVKIRLLDLAGREVRVLLGEVTEPGEQSVIWDGRNDRGEPVPAGIYFYQLQTPGFEATRKLVRLR